MQSLNLKNKWLPSIENETTEYKVEFNEKCKREIAAFLNGTQTAYIYLGIDDNDQGVIHTYSDIERHTIEEKMGHWISSSIYYPSPVGLVYIKIKQNITYIEIKPGDSKPYFLDGNAYVRNGSESVKASPERVMKMLSNQKLDSFDSSESFNQNLTFNDIGMVFNGMDVDFKPNALGFYNSNEKYTNTALLFSNQNVFTVKVAIFEGINVDQFKDRREFGGCLTKQIDDILTFINLNNSLVAKITGNAQRSEKQSYPSVAIREAVINAVVHRSYFNKSPIQIEIFDDRLTIMSPGPLPGGMKIEAVLEGKTLPRNPRIIKILNKLKYIEDYGTGIRRIISKYVDEEVHPQFDAKEDFVKVILPNLNYIDKKLKTTNFKLGKGDTLNSSNLKIIEYLKKNTYISRVTVESILYIKNTQANQLLKNMVDNDILKKVGAGPSTRYVLSQRDIVEPGDNREIINFIYLIHSGISPSISHYQILITKCM